VAYPAPMSAATTPYFYTAPTPAMRANALRSQLSRHDSLNNDTTLSGPPRKTSFQGGQVSAA
jgi:hypothetical protein